MPPERRDAPDEVRDGKMARPSQVISVFGGHWRHVGGSVLTKALGIAAATIAVVQMSAADEARAPALSHVSAQRVALGAYLSQLSKAERSRTCLLGEAGSPVSKVVAKGLGGFGISTSCRPRDFRLYAVVSQAKEPSLLAVDVRRDFPPCGRTWECWQGPVFHGVFEVGEVAASAVVVAYRALVVDGNLAVSDEEYSVRARLVEERIGLVTQR